jgi:hypothetical protein
MKNVIRLTESDLARIVKRVLIEQENGSDEYYFLDLNKIKDNLDAFYNRLIDMLDNCKDTINSKKINKIIKTEYNEDVEFLKGEINKLISLPWNERKMETDVFVDINRALSGKIFDDYFLKYRNKNISNLPQYISLYKNFREFYKANNELNVFDSISSNYYGQTEKSFWLDPKNIDKENPYITLNGMFSHDFNGEKITGAKGLYERITKCSENLDNTNLEYQEKIKP